MSQFIIPYVMLEDSQKATDFYISALGGHIRYKMMGKDMPNCPEGEENRVMHLEYEVNGNVIYMGDAKIPDEHRIELHLNYTDKVAMKAAFAKMKENAQEVQDLKEEFWGAIFGRVVDQFGLCWQFHCRAEQK